MRVAAGMHQDSRAATGVMMGYAATVCIIQMCGKMLKKWSKMRCAHFNKMVTPIANRILKMHPKSTWNSLVIAVPGLGCRAQACFQRPAN